MAPVLAINKKEIKLFIHICRSTKKWTIRCKMVSSRKSKKSDECCTYNISVCFVDRIKCIVGDSLLSDLFNFVYEILTYVLALVSDWLFFILFSKMKTFSKVSSAIRILNNFDFLSHYLCSSFKMSYCRHRDI